MKALATQSAAYVILENGGLAKYVNEKLVICIPKTLALQAAAICHETPWAGHLGRNATLKFAHALFWWPRMSSDIADFVRECANCARFKEFSRRPVMPLGQTDFPHEIWQHVYLDHWTVRDSSEGYKGVLGIIDGFSKFAILEPVKTYKAVELARILMLKILPTYGPPVAFHSDRGPAFSAELHKAMCRATGIDRRLCVPYHPQANGQVERLFRTMKNILGTLTEKFPTRWPEMLPHAAFAYNTSYHRAIDNTPFFVMFGRDPCYEIPGFDEINDNPPVRQFFLRIKEVRANVRHNLKLHRAEIKAHYDRVVARFYQNRPFAVDQLVWLKPLTPVA